MICLKSCSNAFIQTPGCCLQVGSSFPWENSDIFWEERRKGRKERREGERRDGKRREKRGQEGREGRKGKGREGRGKYHFTVSTSFSPIRNKNKLGLPLSKAEWASPARSLHSETRSAHPLPAQAGTRYTRSSGRRPKDHYSPGIQGLQKPSLGGGGASAHEHLGPQQAPHKAAGCPERGSRTGCGRWPPCLRASGGDTGGALAARTLLAASLPPPTSAVARSSGQGFWEKRVSLREHKGRDSEAATSVRQQHIPCLHV